MQTMDEQKIRELLGQYRVEDPAPDLLQRTKCLMHEELRRVAAADSRQAGPILVLAGLSLVLCLNLFYIATVGTILSFTLPANLLVYLRHSLIALGTAGVSLLAGSLMVVFFKVFASREAVAQEL
ncbi:MAG: hypothetical protein JXQ83_05355 [Candidatus Glassbacteria bacterium]|nr:hypothetical protein [Candidatus Glassbacteria bacterium]